MWEKRDALTGGLVDADTEFEIQEWNPEKGQYEKSTHYQVVRRDDGKYTVHLIGDAFFPGWEGKQEALYYHQSNEGKYRIVELRAPSSYNLKPGSIITGSLAGARDRGPPDHPSYAFVGDTADYNMPYKTQVLIKKVDEDTGEFIRRTPPGRSTSGMSRKQPVRGQPQLQDHPPRRWVLHSDHAAQRDWEHYEEGYLYFEDTQQDTPESYHRYSDRRFSNQGKFLIVESKAPAGYYGDQWRNDEPGTHSTDTGRTWASAAMRSR